MNTMCILALKGAEKDGIEAFIGFVHRTHELHIIYQEHKEDTYYARVLIDKCLNNKEMEVICREYGVREASCELIH